MPARERPDRNLAMELVRVTESAALAASRWVGRGDKNAADGAAVDAMRNVLDTVNMDGIVVIGEGEKDEAPMLFNGEAVGDGSKPETDVAVDPIDGTTNFTRGIPVWGISLGLLYRGVPVFGYVAMPPLGQAFYGYWPGESVLEMPSGAYCDGRPIHTSGAAPDKNQFFSLCARSTSVLAHPFPCKIRMLGSATYNLLMVGAGWAIGAVEATPKIWDIAAVWAIVQAAGATWIALDDSNPFPLTVGQDYVATPYPTLVTAQATWVPTFHPLVNHIGQR